MRINTNIASVNTLRQLGKSSEALGKAFGRLSSGFRINKAGDDAAGLGIANRLRADIRSLQQASRNAEQGTSLLQVAEGAAQVIQGILERMKELATQSASDNTTTDGRSKIQDEFADLRDEITRVVDTTQFQGQNLLDGTLGNYVDQDTAVSTLFQVASVASISVSGAAADTYTVSDTAGLVRVVNSATTEAQELTATAGTAQILNFSAFGIQIETNNSYAVGDLTGDIEVVGTATQFMVSSSGNYTGQDLISVSSMDLTVETLGIDSLTAGTTLATAADARAALTDIDGAISVVSGVFGDIGSAQNRMEFSRANVDTAVENFMAAESVIRDADMAFEVSVMTKYQILQQAGTAVLAQANAAPQSILALLS
jgi:flagellin